MLPPDHTQIRDDTARTTIRQDTLPNARTSSSVQQQSRPHFFNRNRASATLTCFCKLEPQQQQPCVATIPQNFRLASMEDTTLNVSKKRANCAVDANKLASSQTCEVWMCKSTKVLHLSSVGNFNLQADQIPAKSKRCSCYISNNAMCRIFDKLPASTWFFTLYGKLQNHVYEVPNCCGGPLSAATFSSTFGWFHLELIHISNFSK